MSDEVGESRKVEAAFNRFIKSAKKDVRHEEWVERKAKPEPRVSIAERARQKVAEKEMQMSPEDRAAQDRLKDRVKPASERDIERGR